MLHRTLVATEKRNLADPRDITIAGSDSETVSDYLKNLVSYYCIYLFRMLEEACNQTHRREHTIKTLR